MRKFALLIAATLVVSAPVIVASVTDTHAAARAKTKAKGMGMAAPAETSGGFFQAFGDQLAGRGGDASTSKSKRRAKGKKKRSG